MNQRLKENFKKMIAQYKASVYLLTGFKVEMGTEPERPKLKIRSMYAENEGDFLLFRYDEDDKLQLLESEYAKTIDPQSFQYLNVCHSIPAFLSNVTLSLFDKQTFLG